jgi:hypothetical protein
VCFTTHSGQPCSKTLVFSEAAFSAALKRVTRVASAGPNVSNEKAAESSTPKTNELNTVWHSEGVRLAIAARHNQNDALIVTRRAE